MLALIIFTISEYADSTITPRLVETYSTSSFNVALLISLLFKSETESMKSNSTQHCCSFWQKSSCCSFEVASLSWGRGCSSAWLPWPRNCDEPCERFCLCALRTDFRVKPSTFSEAEMAAAAQATGAGGDGDDISATPEPRWPGWPGEPAPRAPAAPPSRSRELLPARQRLTAASRGRRRGGLGRARGPAPQVADARRRGRAGGGEPEVWTAGASARVRIPPGRASRPL